MKYKNIPFNWLIPDLKAYQQQQGRFKMILKIGVYIKKKA